MEKEKDGCQDVDKEIKHLHFCRMARFKKMVVPKLNKELFSKVARQTKKQKKQTEPLRKRQRA